MKRWPRIALVAALLSGVACASVPAPAQQPQQATPPDQAVVLVSLDGFRADYLDRMPVPNLRRLAARGVRARWMIPSFPTLTFPNHYTIVTGLRPARHGVVGNTMVDPADGARFRIGDTAAVRASRWWGGEPLWVTVERQGARAASFFWVGSEAEIGGVRPSIWKRYDGAVPNAERVDSVLAWLELPEAERPRFITLYFSDTDDAGHRFGPDAPQLAAAAARVDSALGRLLDGLRSRGLQDRVNVIVVSDHGMAPTSPERRVVLDDYVDRNAVDAVALGAFVALNPRGMSSDSLRRLLAEAPHLRLYPRDGTPERWHYRDNPRIPALVGVMDDGWYLVTRAMLAAEREPRPGGSHGYDANAVSMRAIFVAAGPALRRGVTVPAFENVHVYELICAILGVQPAANDGDPAVTRGMRVRSVRR